MSRRPPRLVAPLAFWCSGGDLIAGQGARISLADARALWSLYQDELAAAIAAGDHTAERRAARLASQLKRAVGDQIRWRKAAGRAP